MNVLFVHTYYLKKGGEDTVFAQEKELLGNTETVQSVFFNNKAGWRGALQFFVSIWNIQAGKALHKAFKNCRPDVVHIHNFHFAIGPIAIRIAKNAGIPVVLTLHNYRLLCPSATLLSNGKVFTESLHQSFPWKAVQNKVYRNSYLLTFWLAFITWFHKKIGTWDMVDQYIVLTDFAKNIFVHSNLNIPADKITVKPNFIKDVPSVPIARKDYYLFVGRLSEEKGIRVLLDAFKQTSYELHVAGEGPLEEYVQNICLEHTNIKYLGNLTKEEVFNAMSECTALIFPSIWYEGMPMTILEAFSKGTPVIASNLGAMSSLIEHEGNGLHFTSGDSNGLKEQIDQWHNKNDVEKEQFRKKARAYYEANYLPDKNKIQLLSVYQHALIH